MCLWYLHVRVRTTVSLVASPYRLIDGDSRVGNPIHRTEDKFHVPQCVSKWVTRRVAVLVRLRLHRETMAPADLCTRVYVRTGRRKPFLHPPPSQTVYIGMAGCRKFLATRIVWIAVRLFPMVILRVHLVLPSTCPFSVFYVKRVSIFKQNASV